MAKYKAGDKVRVRKDLVAGEFYGEDDYFALEMKAYMGEEAIITEVCSDGDYHISIDENKEWFFTDEMFESVDTYTDTEEAKAETVDIGYHLEYCGNQIIKDVYYGGYANDNKHVFCTTKDNKNQYTFPIESIDFIVPHIEV